ncbi:MAG: hypothetical protein ACK4IX_07800, partial [Candidatus Sericytochromatia bacterium]
MDTQKLKNDIVESVKLASEGSLSYKQLFSESEKYNFENQFIFFIKPEVTLKSDTIKFDKVVDLAFQKLEEFDLKVTDVKVLGAEYLGKYNIIAQHYGVINKLASAPLANMSEGAKEKLMEMAKVDSLDNVNVLGGIEFLNKYPFFNADSLDVMLQNQKPTKLAGGTYAVNVKVDTDNVYLIN